MQGGIKARYLHYEKFLDSGVGYSLMYFLRDKQVAQVDFYDITADGINDLYDAGPGIMAYTC